MHLKRDTEYALRIMTCMAEHLKKNRKAAGISSSCVIAETDISLITFNRICNCLEEKKLILKKSREEGDKWLYPGNDFWKQSIFTIGKAVEGNMELFVVFDKNAHFTQTYGNRLEEIQKNLEQVLLKTTLEELVESSGSKPLLKPEMCW